MRDFQRGESMDVNVRHGIFGGSTDRQIGLPSEGRVNTALHADFGRTAIPCLANAAADLREVNHVGLAPQSVMRLAFGEGTKPASMQADVGVIDVSCDHIADGVADAVAPELIRAAAEERKI